MAGRVPEERVRLPAIVQRWEQVTFLHWAVDAAALRPHVPGTLRIDTRDGTAWLSLVLLQLVGSRAGGIVPLPVAERVPQMNLRTYVRDRRGRDGLWFFTLEVASRLVAFGGRRLLGLPYRFATLSVEHTPDGALRYRGGRRGGAGHLSHDITIQPGAPQPAQSADANGLADWLTGRWRAFTTLGPLTMAVATEHPPWHLHHATVRALKLDLAASVRVTDPGDHPLVHYASEVPVRLGVPRPFTNR